MNRKVPIDEVLDAMEIGGMDIKWYFDVEKGKIVLVTDESVDDELDIDEVENNSDRFISLPSEYEIDEHAMMVAFSKQQPIETEEILLDALYSKGAFRKFKDKVFDMDIRNLWFAYKREQLELLAQRWAKNNHLTLITKEEKK